MTTSQTPRERIAAQRAAARKQAIVAINQRYGKRVTAAIVFTAAAQLWNAQLLVWALAMFHIDSGYIAPLIFLISLTAAIAGGVWIGMIKAVRDTRKTEI
jgi:hypothetical protein